MIELKKTFIKVKCLECKKEHFIEMKHVYTKKKQRIIGLEYKYAYKGELKCSDCGEYMNLSIMVWEFPEGFLNYYEANNENCLTVDNIDIPKNFLNIP